MPSIPSDETHDPALTSWLESARGHSEFPIQNLPFGLFSPPGEAPRAGVAIGSHILDLQALVAAGFVLLAPTLDTLLAVPVLRKTVRRQVSSLLSDVRFRTAAEPYLHAATDCTLHLPTRIGDYTDFYTGIHHAETVGRLFRPDAPLLPNYKHVPIGYHGRASSVRPSGEAVVRPQGQIKATDSDVPQFGPSRRLDFELELGVWIGPGNELGHALDIGHAADHIAGFCLLNDWSARDIQAWEYQPLGPFLAKSFHTTISPWIVTPEALVPFRAAQAVRPEGDPQPLPYLRSDADQAHGGLNLDLGVFIQSERMRSLGLPPQRLSQSNAWHMYWTVAQMVTHHASNGCNLMTGDLLGTGTLSGPTPDSCGSLLELSEGGKKPVTLASNEQRTFLEDGDEIILTAHARAPGFAGLGFGDCRARLMPAKTA